MSYQADAERNGAIATFNPVISGSTVTGLEDLTDGAAGDHSPSNADGTLTAVAGLRPGGWSQAVQIGDTGDGTSGFSSFANVADLFADSANRRWACHVIGQFRDLGGGNFFRFNGDSFSTNEQALRGGSDKERFDVKDDGGNTASSVGISGQFADLDLDVHDWLLVIEEASSADGAGGSVDVDVAVYRDGVLAGTDTTNLLDPLVKPAGSPTLDRVGNNNGNAQVTLGGLAFFHPGASVDVAQLARDMHLASLEYIGKTTAAMQVIDDLIGSGTRMTLTPWAAGNGDTIVPDQQRIAQCQLNNASQVVAGVNTQFSVVPNRRADFDGIDDVGTCGTAGSLGSDLGLGTLISTAFAVDDVSSGDQVIAGVLWQTGSPPTQVKLEVRSNGTIRYTISSNGIVSFTATSSIAIGGGDHRLVLFAKPDDTAGMVIDGVVDDSVSVVGTYPDNGVGGMPDFTKDFAIGAFNNNGPFADHLEGKIDHFDIVGSSDVENLTTADLETVSAAMAEEGDGRIPGFMGRTAGVR